MALFDKYRNEIDTDLQDLLDKLIQLQSFSDLLDHAYWNKQNEEDSATAIDLVAMRKDPVEGLKDLRLSAWANLPEATRSWLRDRGISLL